MIELPKSDGVLAHLLDGDLEFDDLNLEQLPQEDVLALLKALRGHALCLSSMIEKLSQEVRTIDEFARPKSKMKRVYLLPPDKRRIVQ